ETPCAATAGPRALSAPSGRVIYEWRLGCPAAGALGIRSHLLLEVAPGHLHFARVTRDAAAPAARALSEREPSWVLAGAPGASSPPPPRRGVAGCRRPRSAASRCSRSATARCSAGYPAPARCAGGSPSCSASSTASASPPS